MPAEVETKSEIIRQLRQDILRMQGLKAPAVASRIEMGMSIFKDAFPDQVFPRAAIHEFLSAGKEQAAATGGFIAGILSGLLNKNGACVWISACRTLFPPALKAFSIEPERIIFVDLQKEKDVLWVFEEALKCDALSAVVGEVKDISFTATRRLQLTVEQSHVTGFVLRHEYKNLQSNACVSRWAVAPLISQLEDGIPGVGPARWHVQLQKIRNGKPRAWDIEWSAGQFCAVPEKAVIRPQQQQKRKTG